MYALFVGHYFETASLWEDLECCGASGAAFSDGCSMRISCEQHLSSVFVLSILRLWCVCLLAIRTLDEGRGLDFGSYSRMLRIITAGIFSQSFESFVRC